MTSVRTLSSSCFGPARIRPACAVAAVAAALVACGGGSSDTAPPSSAQTLGPGAGSVASSDGRVTVTVGDNALQAATAIGVAPAEPDAATAADPALVPGTTYEYTAPDLQVPEQVLIRIDSPHAVAAAATTMPGRAGPSSCDLTSTAGSGANFRIGSGVLRLAA